MLGAEYLWCWGVEVDNFPILQKLLNGKVPNHQDGKVPNLSDH